MTIIPEGWVLAYEAWLRTPQAASATDVGPGDIGHDWFERSCANSFKAGYEAAMLASAPPAPGGEITKGLNDCGLGVPYGDRSVGEAAAQAAYAVLRCCNLIGAGDWRVPERIGSCTQEMAQGRPLAPEAATEPPDA